MFRGIQDTPHCTWQGLYALKLSASWCKIWRLTLVSERSPRLWYAQRAHAARACGCAACAAAGSGWMLSLASAPAIIALGALALVLASAVMAASRCDAAEPTFALVWRLSHHRPVRWQTLWCRGRDNGLLCGPPDADCCRLC